MRKFAFYLPQFHVIPENDKWWGTGFTEWTNVKKAQPLFKNHLQPKHPLGNNYYNLLDMKTVEWQTDLMKEYKVDGLIYYHYYFCGKKLLEKPAENLLKWKDINQPFFFCWANHSWNKSWQGSKEVLIEQKYGDLNEWNQHFEYLLPFFKDERYEKVNNKPLFMIYADFDQKNEMMNFFNKKCKENGFDGIYIIETFIGDNNWKKSLKKYKEIKTEYTNKIFFREHSLSANIFSQSYRFYPYKLWKKIEKLFFNKNHKKIKGIYSGNLFYHIIRRCEPIGKDYIHGIFFEWDNTPRHHERGTIVSPPSKISFFKLMDHLKDEEYVFINAWNEWAEGMVLEPTKENGYKYLEWIKEWVDNNKNS